MNPRDIRRHIDLQNSNHLTRRHFTNRNWSKRNDDLFELAYEQYRSEIRHPHQHQHTAHYGVKA